MSFRDEWPKTPDGKDYNGKKLLSLVRSGKSPFAGVWDVELLIREIEGKLAAKVVDIPSVCYGSNNYVGLPIRLRRPHVGVHLMQTWFYVTDSSGQPGIQGFHVKLSNRSDVLARLARGDVNMPDFDGFPIEWQVPELKFEAAVYYLLRSEPDVMASRLLYYRIPVQRPEPRLEMPRDIAGRRLLLFERAEGENDIWRELGAEGKSDLLVQTARIRAALFNFKVPHDFAVYWLRERLFEQRPSSIPVPVAPTREFALALLASKVDATIQNVGDTIGWEDDFVVVGPVAAAAKQSLLRFVPHMLPDGDDEAALYRLVLEHGDFGIHNVSVTVAAKGRPQVTSLYDWETACIAPAILSDPLMVVLGVDLVAGEDAAPALTRLNGRETRETLAEYMTWAQTYFKELYRLAPGYESAIRAGKDARHLWFALRDWRGEDPEDYFGELGDWAERRMRELGV